MIDDQLEWLREIRKNLANENGMDARRLCEKYRTEQKKQPKNRMVNLHSFSKMKDSH